MKKSTTLAAAAISLLTLAPLLTAVTTDPVGAKKITIPGNALTFIGFEFVEPAEYVGAVSAVGTNTVTVTGIDFDTLLSGTDSYFFEISTGDNAGLNTSIVSWDGSILTVADDLDGLLVADSDRVAIHPLLTIQDVFGDEQTVLAGGSTTTSDLIFMANPNGPGVITVYYSTGGFAGIGWRVIGQGSSDASGLPIYFSDGLYIFKKSVGDSELIIAGSVKMTPSVVTVQEGFTPFNTIYPVGTTLETSGLYDSSNLANSIAAGSSTTADLVYIDSDGDGAIETYYYSSGGFAGIGWRQIGAGAVDKKDTSFESGFGILRRSGSVEIERPVAFLSE